MKMNPERIILALLVSAASAYAQTAFSGGPALDAQIEKAVGDQLIPGAVLLIGHDGRIVYRKAYGSRALIPAREPMTLETIFDPASLTERTSPTSCTIQTPGA